MRAVFAALAFAALVPASAGACELGLEGTAKQGGLMVGTAPTGAAVSVDGKRVRLSPSGRFLVGFGRNAAKAAVVTAKLPGGKTISCTIGVESQNYKIQRIDGLPRRQVTPDPKALARIKADNRAIRAVRRMDTASEDFLTGFAWPLKGRISGVFGSQRILNGKPRSPHNGVDVAAPTGTPIVAPAPGRIVLVHPDMFYTGKSVMIDHGHGLSSIYVHMSKISVEEGERVKRGQEIGRVGKTGRATGPHLHWGVSLFSTHLDPMLLVGKMPK